MSDLAARLQAAAQDVAHAHEDDGGLPVAALAHRARRRRRARAAWTTGAAAVVVVGVAAGAGALVDVAPRPVPPARTATATATATATPSPTPSPTPSAPVRVLPAADPSAAWGTCGALVTAPPAHAADARLTHTFDAAAEASSGGPLHVRVALQAATEDVVLRPAAGPRVVVAHDGVVVAVTDAYGGTSSGWEQQVGALGHTAYLADVVPAVCGTGAGAGTPLPPGAYETWVVQDVAVVPGGDVASDAGTLTDAEVARAVDPSAGLLRTVATGPLPLTVTAATSTPWTAPTGSADVRRPAFPRAGEPLPEAPTTGGPWTLRTTATPSDLPRAQGADVAALPDAGLGLHGTLVYGGRGRAVAHLEEVLDYWLVRDGVVVGSSYLPSDAYTGSLDVGTGLGYDLAAARAPRACWAPGEPCTGEGAPVPPGDYLLVPGVVVHATTVHLDGVATPLPEAPGQAHEAWVVLGTPVPVTVR